MRILGLIISLIVTLSATAKDIQLHSKAERIPYIQAAKVWNPPPKNLTPEDIRRGPKAKGYAKLLLKPQVACMTTPGDLEELGGKTPKFECQLLEHLNENRYRYIFKENGDRRVVKVKYHPPGEFNGEILGEILGTRLLWALGFYADQMFYVDEVLCFGCSTDPFRSRKAYPAESGVRVRFHGAAIEKKIPGDNIEYSKGILRKKPGSSEHIREEISAGGVSFAEMMKYLPKSHAHEERAQRDALRLLAVFMQHVDLKADNQRLTCLETNEENQCTNVAMMIHDIGTSFGVKTRNGLTRFRRVDLETWKNTPIWKNPTTCTAQLTQILPIAIAVKTMDASMESPQISDEGRIFLAELLQNFSQNPSLVRALFEAAHLSPQDIPQWIEAFQSKVEQIRFPLGRDHPQFHCP
ncbi:MAG: hypothetical protein KDD22_03820 [Bdellovibrionales bacterium]|nr:hypothetical protein [Bdellovibrionales bacterium]